MELSLLQRVAEARAAFPTLSEAELARMILDGDSHKPRPITVKEVIAKVRVIYMAKELARTRAPKRADGSMRIHDTSTYRTYDTFWQRIETLALGSDKVVLGDKLVTQLTQSDIILFATEVHAVAKAKRTSMNQDRRARGVKQIKGDSHRTFNAALDAFATLIRYAIDANLLRKEESPMKNAPYKVNEPSRRRGLKPEQLDELLTTALSGGDDPVLDFLLLWTLIETAGRIGGILKMRVIDIDTDEQTVRLYEKGDTVRDQPVSAELVAALLAFAQERAIEGDGGAVFHYHRSTRARGRALTEKRFQTLWRRLRRDLKWADDLAISSHWLRHSVLTLGETRTKSASTLRMFAGHGMNSITEHYTQANVQDTARLHQAIFGGKHPLAS